jgi:hypothetical protein
MKTAIPQYVYDVAKQFAWYGQPAEFLADQDRFLTFAMVHFPEDAVATLRRFYTKQDFINALRNAPPGVFLTTDEWAYWNDKLDVVPNLPFPPRYAILMDQNHK